MKRIGLVIGLALVAFACADSVGQMLVDAGTSIQDGSVPDAGAQDETVTCDKSSTYRQYDDRTQTQRWAEFDVDPGATEVTTCQAGDPASGHPIWSRSRCHRGKAQWFHGTTTGWVTCGYRIEYDNPDIEDTVAPDPISITVHN